MGWREDAVTIHETVKKKWEAWSPEDRYFLALALGGEVGELQNLIKKEWRGDFENRGTADSLTFLGKLVDETADILIYMFLLTRHYKIDWDTACATKIKVLLERWPECRTAVEEARKQRETP